MNYLAKPARWIAVGLLMVASTSSLRAEDKTVAPAEQVEFQQKTIAAQMQELQDRMFRLSELTKTLEPDDSARLVLAVQRAREELIVEQMKDVMDLLDRKDLAKAGEEQRQVLAKLEALKQLLLNANLDLQAQLEQLKKLEAAIKKIDAIAKQQADQRGQTSAEAQKQNPEAAKLNALKSDQEATKQSTDAVSQSVQTLGEGGKNASASLGSASNKMGGAAGSLGGGKPSDAAGEQGQALDELKKAREQLDEQRKKLLAEIEGQVRKQVIVKLTEMLERQKGIRENAKTLAASAAAGDREAGLSVRRLASAEQRIITINDQTLELINQTKFSLALPPALESVGRRCVYVQTDLAAGNAGEKTQAAAEKVEADLKALLETFKQLAANGSKPSECKGCKGDKNKLLAELKVLRLLQVRVNEETADADANRPPTTAELPPEVRAKIGTAQEHQENAHDVAEKIHEAICPECLSE